MNQADRRSKGLEGKKKDEALAAERRKIVDDMLEDAPKEVREKLK